MTALRIRADDFVSIALRGWNLQDGSAHGALVRYYFGFGGLRFVEVVHGVLRDRPADVLWGRGVAFLTDSALP